MDFETIMTIECAVMHVVAVLFTCSQIASNTGGGIN